MFVVLAGWWACACTPGGLTVEDETTDSSTPMPTADTAPEAPCAYPEAEPNDIPADATPVVMEQRMCGALATGDVVDVFSVELDDNGWVEVEIQGDEGSILMPNVFFQGADLAFSARATVTRPDVTRRVELAKGSYTVAISDMNAGSGDRYTYRALVSEIKAPVKWTVEEEEVNDTWRDAQILVHGDAVFARMDDGDDPDQDWYRVAVPPGRHDLTIDVQAINEGSGANLVVEVFDESIESVLRITGGAEASDPDPQDAYGSAGDEVLFVQVSQQGEQIGGVDRWYALRIGVEAP